MSTAQLDNADLWERIETFVGASLSDELTAFQLAEFEQLLDDNPEAQDLYVRFIEMSVTMPHALGRVCCKAEFMADLDADDGDDTELVSCKVPLSYIDPIQCFDAPPSPIPSFNLSGACRHTIAYFSQVGPLSYLIAALLLGVGILTGSFIRIQAHRFQEFTNQSPSRSPEQMISPEKAKMVAQITGLDDCRGRQWSVTTGRWSEITTHQLENKVHNLHLGDRFHLASGLMQITYESGAKVLLQGPCTYEIDSNRGGYLTVGKLTALVEKKGEISNPQSLTPNPLFAIRTPTAVVTDLVGAEVEETGATRSHVFQGSVEVRSSNSRRLTTSGEPVKILHAGESVRVERGRKGLATVTRKPGQPDRFIRQIPNLKSRLSSTPRMSPDAYAEYVLSLEPVAYYRMDRPKPGIKRLGVFDSAPGNRHHGLFVSSDTSVTPYTKGLFGDAMSFRGTVMHDSVVVPGIPNPKDKQFTVAAWVKTDVQQEDPAIAMRWGYLRTEEGKKVGKGFQVRVLWHLPLHRWHHVAYVVHRESDNTVTSMYLNGQYMRTDPFEEAWFSLSGGYWCIGSADPKLTFSHGPTKRGWQGQIDEFAIFHKALSPEMIEQLYRGGTAAVKGDGVISGQ